MGDAIRVMVVDDHAVVRTGLARILETMPDIKTVGEAKDGLEAISKAQQLKPDVILMDILMPGCTGLEATVAIKKNQPEARVLILTVSEREEDLFQALRFGAQGYLLKSSSISELTEAVRRTAAGEAMLSPAIASRLISEFRQKQGSESNLSKREAEVLGLIGDGFTNTEIGSRLFISESTVRTHLSRLLEKLQLRNRAEAVAYAARRQPSISSKLTSQS